MKETRREERTGWEEGGNLSRADRTADRKRCKWALILCLRAEDLSYFCLLSPIPMPPKKGIVKSGNSGNSSKATSSKTPAELPKPEEKPLFPPGSKYPLILLRERY